MTKNKVNVQKYTIDLFKKEKKPYSMILNDVIQRVPAHRMKEAFLWIFLESLPYNFIPHKNYIMSHFGIRERTYKKWMDWLNAVNLIEYRQTRNKNGTFGKSELIVLNGSNFNPNATSTGEVNIDNSLMHKKKQEVIHKTPDYRVAKNCTTVKFSETSAIIDDFNVSPKCTKTVVRLNDIHTNTIIKNKKEKEKQNREPLVSVFSCKDSVKNHIERVISNREVFLEEEIIEQGVYYVYEKNPDKSFYSVNKLINIFLKKVREGDWLIPKGFNGITSKSIREKEDLYSKEKKENYEREAMSAKIILEAVKNGNGFSGFRDMFKKLKEGTLDHCSALK